MYLWTSKCPGCGSGGPGGQGRVFQLLYGGYLAHLFAFANLIPNADGLSRVYDPQQMTVSGRWFLHYASALNDFTQMPAAIGLVTMVLLVWPPH